MLSRLKKYRNPLFFLLLIAYFSSAFQQPLFEAIHILSHIAQGEDYQHSHAYYHENNIDHDHPLLMALDSKQEQDNHHGPVDQETKKKVELRVHAYEILHFDNNLFSNNFLFLMASSIFQKDCLSPPPKFV